MRPGGTVSQIFGAENLKDVLPKLVDTLGIAILSIIIVYTIAFKSISNGLVSRNTGAFQRVSPHHKPCATQRTLQFGNISAPFLAGGGGLLRISSDGYDRFRDFYWWLDISRDFLAILSI